MQTITQSKIDVLNIVSVALTSEGTSSLVYQSPAKPLNILSGNCSPDLFKKGYSKFLGMTFPYYIDSKGNRYLNIKTVAALSGRQRNSVDMFFRKRDAMLRVGYRPKHFGGRPMKSKFGVAHVNENLIPFLNAMTYIRTRPELKTKKGK